MREIVCHKLNQTSVKQGRFQNQRKVEGFIPIIEIFVEEFEKKNLKKIETSFFAIMNFQNR